MAHATGGLRDTITDADAASPDHPATGWLFAPPDTGAMLSRLDAALHVWRHDRARWDAIQAAGMSQDLSWDRAARQYEQILEWALMDPPVRPG